jgi:hypothetical protein
MSTGQAAGLLNAIFGQGALLKALEVGVTPNHLALLRSGNSLIMVVANFIIERTITPTAADDMLLSILKPERFFGPADWTRHFGIEMPESISLPIPAGQLQSILESPCPFIKGKKVKETHYLYRLPVDFNGEPLTIGKRQEMFPQGSQPKFYRYMNVDAWYKDYGFAKTDTARFSWFLMFEGEIPGTESKNWDEQLALKPDNYDVPKLVECAPMHFLAYKNNDGQWINENMWGRTCDVNSDGDHVYAGYFVGDGFYVFNDYDSDRNSYLGLFLFRKL